MTVTEDGHGHGCPRAGQSVVFERCGSRVAAVIDGWAYVSGKRGIVCGRDLADPRYAATSLVNGWPVHIVESDIVPTR
jgi:hypothetical protein